MKRTRLLWRDVQWMLLGLSAGGAVVLGILGFGQFFARSGQDRNWTDLVYLTLQLFTLESGSLAGSVPWPLEAARFLAPAATVLAALSALALLLRHQIQFLRVQFWRGHVVVCGLGDKGVLIVQRLRERGLRVAAVEMDEGNDWIEPCRKIGAAVFIGSALDRGLLKQAGLGRARLLISVCGDDGVNAETALLAREIKRASGGSPLTCLVQVIAAHLYRLLREKEMQGEPAEAFRFELLNVYDFGAREWLKEFPLFSKDGAPSSPPHLLIVGLGRMGESLAVHAGRAWFDRRGGSAARMRLTVIDRLADKRLESLRARFPRLSEACDVEALSLEVSSAAFLAGRFLFDERGGCRVTSVAVCLDDDSTGLSAGLALHQHLRGCGPPVVVRMYRAAGLASLLPLAASDGRPTLQAFGLLDRTLRPELLLHGAHEILARAIHEKYVQDRVREGETFRENPALVPWDRLPESLKESNRRQADHAQVKLKSVGCGLAPLTDWQASDFTFTPAEEELLARLEHVRWMEERKRGGWKYGAGPKDVKRKTSPFLVPYDRLPEAIKQRDMAAVRALPRLLARVDLQVYRLRG